MGRVENKIMELIAKFNMKTNNIEIDVDHQNKEELEYMIENIDRVREALEKSLDSIRYTGGNE